ncbi:nudC domain-containing protein 3 isoform X1 [Hylaeus anthracinus]|uniref:nudC domain-containing protein 3 isoform X1 n=1 Tax=Hylaeus anthracinus TaxID=313031 RepID=UPI0023B9D697|nr:nudC domain-containing protein 3 isoform X1 [Hylaeus anthracinus]
MCETKIRMNSNHDQAFLQILREEKNVTNFLDAFFGFLYRCTDFYIESTPDQKLGFRPGIAEKLVSTTLQKWKNVSKCPSERSLPKNEEDIDNLTITKGSNVPESIQEIEVETCEKAEVMEGPVQSFERDRSSDSYNGAERENYSWSQSIGDLDVLVKLPSCIKTAKDLRVNLDSQEIQIEARTSTLVENKAEESCNSEWTIIFKGELCFKTRKDESVWSIVPGQHISIHFEKASDRWWEALIVGEPKIELSKIDCSRNLDEMGSEEQMKVQELMWNHQQKLLGKPTSEQIKMEKILKKAWDAKGSPFEGTPYDPSILKFN